MAYINPAPGTTSQIILRLDTVGASTITETPSGSGNVTAITLGANPLQVLALQDMTINASNDVMTWSQLDSSAKLQVATTSTNSISMNIVVDPTTFFGESVAAAQTDTVKNQGLMGLSRNKTFIAFTLKMREGGTASGSTDHVISGRGYITGLAPTVSADAPVWVSPITITVTGEYLVTNPANVTTT